MKLLAVVLAVPTMALAWLAYQNHAIEQRLEPIASAIAGRAVEVDCQGLAGSLLDVQAREGEVRFDAAWVPEPKVFLTRRQCSRLADFAGRRTHAELDCLRPIDWSTPGPLRPGSDCYERSSPTIYALLVLAHEAYHTAGVTTESLANCYALQAMGYAAVRLGADRGDAEVVALAMEALAPLQSGDYGTDECHAGTELDLAPQTPAFPTEWPPVPPLGRGGVKGIASGA